MSFLKHLSWVIVVLSSTTACRTVVDGHERALLYSGGGLKPDPVGPGVYWHAADKVFYVYDLRWSSHKEDIHIHSKDGLHMDIEVVAVVRPDPAQLYQLHTEVGPDFYNTLVRPAVFAATRDASAKFNHLEIATQTHAVESAIRESLTEHLKGKHLELSEVAIQHFDLPKQVEDAANRKAAAGQLLAAKEVDVRLAETDARIELERRRGAAQTEGVESELKAKQELATATADLQIQQTRSKLDLAKAQADGEAIEIRAKAEAEATKVRAQAEKIRVASEAQPLTANYVKLKSLEALKEALSGDNTKIYVLPTGKNGLPMFFNPFMNPLGKDVNPPQ